MAIYGGKNYTKKLPAVGGGGLAFNDVKLHDSASITAALTTSDTVIFGMVPQGAVITGAALRAVGQLDTNGSPTLAFNFGLIPVFAPNGTPASIASTAQIKAAITGVGRASTASLDAATLNAAVVPYVCATDMYVVAQPSTGAATGAAGILEAWVSYHMEPAAGRAP